jgi:hypothetical protein
MQNFKLQLHYKLQGIGATSGLILIDNELFIISDNSSYLYKYYIINQQLNKIKLLENSQENIIKKQKPDFEAITQKNGKLYLFGSGSTSKRELRITYDLKTHLVEQKDLSKLYKNLKQNANLEKDELNIEGAIFHDNNWYFFQRGNGENAQNGVFTINQNKEISFVKITLPKVQNIEATFTDAVFVNNKFYFLAAVENTNSTYNDGEILGSFIGCLSIVDLQLEFCTKISETQKFEGLTFLDNPENKINFLLCEDNDTEELVSNIYKLELTH